MTLRSAHEAVLLLSEATRGLKRSFSRKSGPREEDQHHCLSTLITSLALL